MSANDLSNLLWRERELLELLVFKLEEEQLLLTAGKSRWLPQATRERIGDHRGLDGTGVDDLLACQRGYQRGGEVEGGKGGQHRTAFRLIQRTHRRFGKECPISISRGFALLRRAGTAPDWCVHVFTF